MTPIRRPRRKSLIDLYQFPVGVRSLMLVAGRTSSSARLTCNREDTEKVLRGCTSRGGGPFFRWRHRDMGAG